MTLLPPDTPLTADHLLGAWAYVPGPDLSDPRSSYGRPGCLALRSTPTHDRHHAEGRRLAPCERVLEHHDAAPPETAGLNTVWSANAPPIGADA